MPLSNAKPSQALILSLAFLMTTLVYVVIAFVLAQSNGWALRWQILPEFKLLLFIFGGLACVLAAAVLMLPQLGRIPRLALAEAVAILGLVLVFLHQSPFWVLPFVGLSLVLQIFLFPSSGQSSS